ncbi:MAG: SIS domain-containing protein [Firmicutes bacterium]|jgi:uncharacterized phosphosugar-binding protein|nr:SIS domain-containing protein [Bacillota bacterium]
MSQADSLSAQANDYLQKVSERLQWLARTQQQAVARAGTAVARALANEGLWYIFGTGHSHMLAEEAFYRAGGLVSVVPILESSLMLHESALQSSYLERLPGFAEVILGHRGISSRDVLTIVSNSGRNALPVEMARLARARGITTIGITSLTHSGQVGSRDPSGKRLFEVVDIVIDNGAPYGDALIDIDGGGQRMGPLSTITGATIINAIAIDAAARLRGQQRPVATWVSANVDDGTDEDQGILEPRMRGRYRHL